jgi:hypothetical protein
MELALDGIPPIFWINLADSTRRRTYMETLLTTNTLTHTRVEAYAGSNLESFASTVPYANSSEAGCICSHFKALETFLQTDLSECLVAEDDLALDFTPYWKKTYRQYMEDVPADWSIVQLSQTVHMKCHVPPTSVNKRVDGVWGAVVYRINREAAAAVLAKVNKDDAGRYILEGRCFLSEHYIYGIENVYTIALFSTNDVFRSTIHPENVVIYHIPSKEILKKAWLSAKEAKEAKE